MKKKQCARGSSRKIYWTLPQVEAALFRRFFEGFRGFYRCGDHYHLVRRRLGDFCDLALKIVFPSEEDAIYVLQQVGARKRKRGLDGDVPKTFYRCNGHFHVTREERTGSKCRHGEKVYATIREAQIELARVARKPKGEKSYLKCDNHFHLTKRRLPESFCASAGKVIIANSSDAQAILGALPAHSEFQSYAECGSHYHLVGAHDS